MYRKTSIVVLATAAVLIALTALSAARTAVAAPPTAENTVAVYSLVDGKAVPGARSTLSADPASVTVMLHSSGLPIGSETQVWWFVYNTPEQCRAGTEGARCGFADLWNELAQPSAFYAKSQIIGRVPDKLLDHYPALPIQFYGSIPTIDDGGKGDFLMRRVVGDQTDVVFGSGVTNPQGAEIHLILVSCVQGEGPAAGLASARSYCEKQQYAVHQQ